MSPSAYCTCHGRAKGELSERSRACAARAVLACGSVAGEGSFRPSKGPVSHGVEQRRVSVGGSFFAGHGRTPIGRERSQGGTRKAREGRLGDGEG